MAKRRRSMLVYDPGGKRPFVEVAVWAKVTSVTRLSHAAHRALYGEGPRRVVSRTYTAVNGDEFTVYERSFGERLIDGVYTKGWNHSLGRFVGFY